MGISMPISSKELGSLAILRANPPLTPIYYFNRDQERSDTWCVSYAGDSKFVPTQPNQSEWGYVWHVLDGTMGQPTNYPLQDWSNISSYIPPDPCAPSRYTHLAAEIAAHKDKYMIFGIGISGFNQATFIRGFEEFMMDLYEEPEQAEKVLDMVFGFENSIIEQTRNYDIDCYKFGDDWGTQQGLLVSPAIWRKLFKPRYAQQFKLIHDAGKKVWFHSCGQVYDIIEDLIEVGVDVIELLQPDLEGIERMGEQFAGRVCFCCSIDHQRVAVSGTRDEIFAYAKKLKRYLGANGGGFIAYIEDYASLGMSDQNYHWICEAFEALNP